MIEGLRPRIEKPEAKDRRRSGLSVVPIYPGETEEEAVRLAGIPADAAMVILIRRFFVSREDDGLHGTSAPGDVTTTRSGHTAVSVGYRRPNSRPCTAPLPIQPPRKRLTSNLGSSADSIGTPDGAGHSVKLVLLWKNVPPTYCVW